jgi:ABC-type transport system involved in multi-copper enzyme maturation permease subunit
MLLTVVKRELTDHVMSFRFSAIFVITVILMVISVLVSSSSYNRAIKEYPARVEDFVNEDGKTNLEMVACLGGATVNRTPSPLAFCSGTGERQLPNQAAMGVHGLTGFQRTEEIGEIFSGASTMDWAFVIAVVFSFGAGLLTYKSISGELSDGTLTLTLSQPVPRGTVLLGKYIAALLALVAVFLVGMLLGLMVLQSLDGIQLRGDDWLKIGVFAFASVIYLSSFILIGLLCSVFARVPLVSAITFLFIWSGLVFIIPNLGGIIAGQVGGARTPLQVHEANISIPDQLSLTPGMSADEVASVKLRREQVRERLLMEYLQSLTRQVDLGQDLARISPASAFSFAAERITGGGMFRFEKFVSNASHYREGLFQAIIEADRHDPASEHRYVPWVCGGNHFSRLSVDLGAAAQFRDALPSSLEGLSAAFWDILLLIMYNLIAFALTFWRFARQDVAPTPGV